MVTRLDRLARSTMGLLNVMATISDREEGFRSLSDQWADTTTPVGRLMLTVLEGLAEFEPDPGQGQSARAVKFGRKPKLTQHQVAEATEMRDPGEAVTDIGRSYKVSHSTISRL
jgi:Resolvase, N terminal domain/Helix-turn-helix domain of resolvase